MAERIKKQILDMKDDPDGLEDLYRSDPEHFKKTFLSLVKDKPGSKLFKFWRVRLEYSDQAPIPPAVPLAVVLLIAAFFGLMVRIPETFLTDEWYYPRFAPFFTILAVATYFLFKKPDRLLTNGLVIYSIITSLYLTVLPDWQSSDSVTMALIHLPLTVLVLLGICFAQKEWREREQRIAFIRFCGELLVLGTLILISGGVLTAFALGLFELMDVDIGEWYLKNVGVFGMVSTPLIAAHIYDSILKRKLYIAVLLAKIFSPLFCIFVFSYIVVMMIGGNSPFVNREFLVVFNGLLILILAIVIFSVTTRTRNSKINITDYVNIFLVSGTILINVLALSAITFRLFEYGITPNRFCVLGVNWIVFIHLIIIAIAYARVITQQSDFDLLRKKVVGYLPVYCCWFIFITYFLPLIFRFV